MNDLQMVIAYFSGLITYEQLLREVNLNSLQPEVQQEIEARKNRAD